MEVIDIDRKLLLQWEEVFFSDISDESTKFIDGELSNEMSIYIEFQENEIVFFLNGIYIGNLGGHFEAWFLTWQELLAFEKHPFMFLLLLPMTGIERDQIEEAKEIIAKQLEAIPSFETDATYIAYCIVNGLIIDQSFFIQNDFGIVNQQNHSVRNIEQYPSYQNNVKELNIALSKFMESP